MKRNVKNRRKEGEKGNGGRVGEGGQKKEGKERGKDEEEARMEGGHDEKDSNSILISFSWGSCLAK